MLDVERHEKILEYLGEHDKLEVEEAMALLGASPATVRRDFSELHRKGLVQRVRGGLRRAVPQAGEMPFALRQIRHSQAKLSLARRAAALLEAGDVVIIDGGTTTFHLSDCLPDIPLQIITNSMRLAAALDEKRQDRSNPEIHITGGLLYPGSGLLLGPGTQASLEQYYAQWAFISVGGICEDGISNTSSLVAESERLMIRHAQRVAVLADRSKLGKHAMTHVCGLERVQVLITNPLPEDEPLLARIREAGVEVLMVD